MFEPWVKPKRRPVVFTLMCLSQIDMSTELGAQNAHSMFNPKCDTVCIPCTNIKTDATQKELGQNTQKIKNGLDKMPQK